MPHLVTFAWVACALTITPYLRAAPFQNLDFEQATIAPAASGFVPSVAQPALDSALALPHWAVTEDTTICTAVWGQANILDLTSVALDQLGTLYVPTTPPIQGTYDVQLYSATSPFRTASISQTGDIPSETQSIQFLIRPPPGDSNIPSIPYVFLNNVPIPVTPLSTSDGITTMAGDISAFAGTTATLTFEAVGQNGVNIGFAAEDIYELDDIRFSSTPVPEPASLALLLAALPLLTKRPARR